MAATLMFPFRCPQCSTVVRGEPGQLIECSHCGFKAAAPDTASLFSPRAAPAAPTRDAEGASAAPAIAPAAPEPALDAPADVAAAPAVPAPSKRIPKPHRSAPKRVAAPKAKARPARTTVKRRPAKAKAPEAALPQRFLVVDDSPTIRAHLSNLLGLVSPGEDAVAQASSAKEALTMFRRVEPRVVFLDMMMPNERDGVAALSAILKENQDATVIVVTALDENHRAVRNAMSQGAKGYLRKPITMRGLKQVLDELEAQSGRFRRVS